jgi:hypothetical protein
MRDAGWGMRDAGWGMRDAGDENTNAQLKLSIVKKLHRPYGFLIA